MHLHFQSEDEDGEEEEDEAEREEGYDEFEEADFLVGLDDDDDDDEEEEDENEDEEEEDDRYRCVIAFDSSYELSFQVISHTHCDDLYAPPSGPWSLLSQGRRLPRPNPANRARKGCSNA